MNKTIVYSLIAVAGVVLASIMYSIQNSDEVVEPKVNSVIMIDGKIPPQLSDLFPDREAGPHQKFIDENQWIDTLYCECRLYPLAEFQSLPAFS